MLSIISLVFIVLFTNSVIFLNSQQSDVQYFRSKVEEAKRLFENGQFERAIYISKAVIPFILDLKKEEKKHLAAEAYFYLGSSYVAQNKMAEAEAEYINLLKINEEYTEKIALEEWGPKIINVLNSARIKWEKEITRIEESPDNIYQRKTIDFLRTEMPPGEIGARIKSKIEENRKLMIQNKEYDRAIKSLRPLLADTIKVEDKKRRSELAAEIYLWIGLASAAQGDESSALVEFNNMFEIDHEYAKEISRYIYDPNTAGLIEHAEKKFLGIVTEYYIDISTEPKESEIKINGKKIGLSPQTYRTFSPNVVIEIIKEGYKPVKEDIFLVKAITSKEYVLEKLGRHVEIKSVPSGAKVYLDDKNTEKVSNCLLRFVPFGPHKIKIFKENYSTWEKEVEITDGDETMIVDVILTALKYQHLKIWGGPLKKIFLSPRAVSVDKDNNAYIVDLSSSKIKKFNQEGRPFKDLGSKGWEFKRLRNPAGIAVDSKGNIYVTDSIKHCVMKFNGEGKFIKKWGAKGSQKYQFNTPLGISVDYNDDIYVIDSLNNRIKKFSEQGVLKKTWGSKGNTDGNFILSVAVAVNKKNEVFVLDRFRVQKFSSEGEFLGAWGKPGSGDAEFKNPRSIFIDKDSYIYVADSSNNRIQKFDENGKFITMWGSKGKGNGQLDFPCGIAIDGRGYVFVTEKNNNRVQIFGVALEPES